MSEKKIKASVTSVYTADIFCTLRNLGFFLFYNECLSFSFFFLVCLFMSFCVLFPYFNLYCFQSN